MSCLDVRDLLAERALDALPPATAAEVERHLEGCPGCRKEAEGLREAAAAIGLGVPLSLPPARLAERVTGAVAAHSGPSGREPRRSTGRSARVLVGAALTAALVAVLSVGWAMSQSATLQRAMSQTVTLQQRVRSTEATNKQLANQIASLVAEVQGTVFVANLAPPVGRQGVGAAVLIAQSSAPGTLVVWATLRREAYHVMLVTSNGRSFQAGDLVWTPNDDYVLSRLQVPQNLAKVVSVVVFDAKGRVALSGTARPYAQP